MQRLVQAINDALLVRNARGISAAELTRVVRRWYLRKLRHDKRR